MTKIKVCGIQQWEAAKWAVDAGADAVGFIFADSRRKVSMERAAAISGSLPGGILKIGVFVNASKEDLQSAVEMVNLDYVQLHGDESPEFCRSLGIPYIKAVSIKEKDDLDILPEYGGDMVLVDSGKGPYRGGNGTSFDWDYLKDSQTGDRKLILAGGLQKGNVREAIQKVRPYMVDVSSGVESSGIKDKEKIMKFIKEVREVNSEMESGELK
ncbi:phosphoribosylanthranilate isomerase [Bacillus haikouensis]|uniref:phosphoribosylanthranilate isomerase n=1 Tax=Bacillus haikouensis TaxID=1510468 RepID=UPI001556E2E7|nr:phosphoribosylanthranilate isomerase [Bacillus haikouensis]NQD67943.1 phosphoribosylanthranilate isomerase [Bacillus haikouensis]